MENLFGENVYSKFQSCWIIAKRIGSIVRAGSGEWMKKEKSSPAFSIPLFARDALETSARSYPDNFFGIRLIFPAMKKHCGQYQCPRNPVAVLLPVPIVLASFIPPLSCTHSARRGETELSEPVHRVYLRFYAVTRVTYSNTCLRLRKYFQVFSFNFEQISFHSFLHFIFVQGELNY